MNPRYWLACLAIMVFLGGVLRAAPDIGKMTVAEIMAKSRITRDDFKKHGNLRMLKVQVGGYQGRLSAPTYSLDALKLDGGKAEAFIVFTTIRARSEGWAFWNECTDTDGASFRVESFERYVGDGGWTREIVGIDLTRDYLVSHAETGIKIRIDGKNAKQEVAIPASYIQAFIAKMDIWR